MTAFAGYVSLDGDAPVHPFHSVSLPDQPGLGPLRLVRRSGSVLLHRQRIIAPEGLLEAQPTPAWGENGFVLFDGRLHDRSCLAEQLGVHDVMRVPDSVLAARAFEKWGEEAPAHLLGEYALAAWHEGERRLILANDATSSHSLYYVRRRNAIMFSTVLPALLRFPDVPRELDELVVADFLANNNRDSRNSFYKGILRVLGGETVVCSGGSDRLIDTHPFRPAGLLRLRDHTEYLEAARNVLDEAVKSSLRSIRPVPLMGSSGLDSACLATSILRVNGGANLPMFTLVPKTGSALASRAGKYHSERSGVELLKSTFDRLAVEFVEPEPDADLSFAPERVFEEAGIPLRNILNVGWAESLYRRVRESGATSFVNGGGGNFTLTWDGLRSLSTLFRNGNWFGLLREAGALGHCKPRSTAGWIWREALLPHLRRPSRDTDWLRNSSINPKTAAELAVAKRIRNSGHDPRYIGRSERQDWVQERMSNGRALLGELNGWIRARYGLDVSRPLIDLRVIRFCMAIPDTQFLHNGERRWLARRLLRASGVPSPLAANTGRGAWCPEWFTHLNARKPLLESELAVMRESAAVRRLIDVDRLTRMVQDWPTDAAAAEPRRLELDTILTRALHVGAFIQWAERGTRESRELPAAS